MFHFWDFHVSRAVEKSPFIWYNNCRQIKGENMKLIEMVDKHLENPYAIHTGLHRGYNHPSQASCLIKNEYGEEVVAGKCLRDVYWQHKGIGETNPMTARGERICSVGKMVEKFEIEQYKQLGIWRDNNVKFFDPRTNVSGEADCVVWDSEKSSLRGVEIKSGYDYKFRTDVIGTPTRPGKPKMEHLLQTMLYIDYFKFPFSLVYIDRGNAARREYEITLNTDGTPNIDGKKLLNGISIPRCVARFKELEECVKDGVLPRRDFQARYSRERVEFLYNSRRLNKGQTEEFEKSKNVDMGDYQCGYCERRDYCRKQEEAK
jgi:hypothetical protein